MRSAGNDKSATGPGAFVRSRSFGDPEHFRNCQRMDEPIPIWPPSCSQAVAESARAFLETVWPDWQEEGREADQAALATLSTGVCGRSSVFLQRVLEDRGIPAVVRFGWFIVDPRDAALDRHRHAWVEADDQLLDVTADQFGHPPVITSRPGDPQYILGVDVADEQSRHNRVRTADDLWPRWIQSPLNLALVRPA